jgi:hypothetical protein
MKLRLVLPTDTRHSSLEGAIRRDLDARHGRYGIRARIVSVRIARIASRQFRRHSKS